MKLRHRLWSLQNWLRGYRFGPVQRFRCCGHTTPYAHNADCTYAVAARRGEIERLRSAEKGAEDFRQHIIDAYEASKTGDPNDIGVQYDNLRRFASEVREALYG